MTTSEQKELPKQEETPVPNEDAFKYGGYLLTDD